MEPGVIYGIEIACKGRINTKKSFLKRSVHWWADGLWAPFHCRDAHKDTPENPHRWSRSAATLSMVASAEPASLPVPPLGSLSNWLRCHGIRGEPPAYPPGRTKKQNWSCLSLFPFTASSSLCGREVGKDSRSKTWSLIGCSWTALGKAWSIPSLRGVYTFTKGHLILTKPYELALRSWWWLFYHIRT